MANTTFNNRKFIDYAINHVNDDHRKEMIQIVKVFTEFKDVKDVTLLDYDATGMQMNIAVIGNDVARITVDFPTALKTPQDFRPVLVEMVKTPREELKK